MFVKTGDAYIPPFSFRVVLDPATGDTVVVMVESLTVETPMAEDDVVPEIELVEEE